MRRRTNGGVLNTRQRRERKIASSEMNRRQRERRKTKRGSRRAGQPQIHGFRTPYRRQEQPGEIQPPEAKAKKPPAQATWRGPARSPPSSFRSRRRRESREHSVAQESESLESPGTPPPPPPPCLCRCVFRREKPRDSIATKPSHVSTHQTRSPRGILPRIVPSLHRRGRRNGRLSSAIQLPQCSIYGKKKPLLIR